MAETTASATKSTTAAVPTPNPEADGQGAKARFAKAVEEAKAGVQALGKEAQAKAGDYREQAGAKGGEWFDDAKAYGNQAKDKAAELAVEGKARASEALLGLGKVVEENAETIDAKLGLKYGDYARKAGSSIQDAAARLEEKELSELGNDAREFVRKSPALAVGIAAAAGFLLARVFRGSND